MSFLDALAALPPGPIRSVLFQLPPDARKALREACRKSNSWIAAFITALHLRWLPESRSTYQQLHTHFPNATDLIIGDTFKNEGLSDLLLLQPAILSQTKTLSLTFKVEQPSLAASTLQNLVEQSPTLTDLNLTWDLSDPATLTVLTALTSLTRLNVSGINPATDVHLAALSSLPQLAALDASKVGPTVSTIEGTFLSSFTHMTSLTSLELRSCQLTPAGVAAIALLPSLLHLDLGASYLGGPEMAPIAKLSTLKSLLLNGGNLTSEGLEAIANLKRLTRLNISSPESVPINAVAHLGSLTQLEQLDAQGCPTNQDGLMVLARLPALSLLTISLTTISASSIPAFPALVTLNAICTPVLSDAGLATLVAACPKLEQLLLKGLKGITDAGMAAFVAQVPPVKRLVMEGLEGIKDKGMECLAALATVESLGLGDTNGITPNALQSIARMPALRQLKMCRCQLLIRHRMFAQVKLEAHIASLMPNVEFEYMYFRGRYALFT